MTDEELNRRFDQLQESMRDMQAEILRGLERFARGNFARMHRLEVSDNDLNERINALEERITVLSSRLEALTQGAERPGPGGANDVGRG